MGKCEQEKPDYVILSKEAKKLHNGMRDKQNKVNSFSYEGMHSTVDKKIFIKIFAQHLEKRVITSSICNPIFPITFNSLPMYNILKISWT